MRIIIPTRAGLVAVTALLLAACGSGDDASTDVTTVPTPPSTVSPDDGGDSAGDPDGSWIATTGSLDGAAVELIDGWDVTLTIDGDRIGGTAACNGYGGVASIGDDGSFAIRDVSITEMGCEPAVQALEQAFVAALGEFDTIAIDGDTMILVGGGHEWTFERLAPVDDAAIVGTTWVLDTYISGSAATNVPGMDDATLTLHDDGTLTGSTGCRALTGEWTEAGAEIRFTTFGAEGECPPELQELDGWVVSVLGDGFRPTVEGDRLTVMSQGDEGLSYTATDVGSAATGEVAADIAGAELDPAGGVDGSVVYAAEPDEPVGEEALLTGEVTFDHDGCIRVGGDVVVWRFGTTWQEEPPAVLVDGLTLSAGDVISAGGGSHGLGDGHIAWWTESDAALERLRSCRPGRGDGVFVIQHPIERVG